MKPDTLTRTWRMRIMGAALLAAFSGSCASHSAAGTCIQHITEGHNRYSPRQYLVGIGRGTDQQSAEDNARAEIAKIFLVRIESKTSGWDRYVQISSGSDVDESRNLSIRQMTSASTNKILSGVTVIESCLDSDAVPPVWHAMAVLNRARAQNALLEKIAEKDEKIRLEKEASETATAPLIAAQHLHQAVLAATERSAMNEELRIVNPGGVGIQALIEPALLKNDLDQILSKQLPVAVTVEGPYREEIRHALCEGLTRQGFFISTSDTLPPDALLVQASVSFTPAETTQSAWHFVRWSVQCSLTARNQSEMVGHISSTGKSGHLTPEAALQRAVQDAETRLASEIGARLSESILGHR